MHYLKELIVHQILLKAIGMFNFGLRNTIRKKNNQCLNEWKIIDFNPLKNDFNPDLRIFARSSSDSKGPAMSFISALEILHSNMTDDGIIALTTGNVNSLLAKVCGQKWHLYTLPEHLWFFSPETLSALLAKCGFEVVELKTEWSYFSIHYIR